MHHRPDSEDDTGQGGRSPRRSSRSRRLAKAALFGGFVALLSRTGVRGRVLDALFGPEEEFEYESETEPEPLSGLSADPADAAEDSEDHDEEPDAPAEEEPHDVARAPWQPPSALGGSPQVAQPWSPGDPSPVTDEPEPPSPPDEAPEEPLAPRIFVVPSVPAAAPHREEADPPPPATGEAVVGPDTPASYIRTPPASYVPDAAASDVPDTEAAAPVSPDPLYGAPEPPADGDQADGDQADGDQADGDRRYTWGGDATVEVLAPAAGEEPPDDERSPDAGAETSTDDPAPVVTDHPLPRGDEFPTLRPSPGVFASPGGPPPAHGVSILSRLDVEPEAPAPPREPTDEAGPLSDFTVEPLADAEASTSDDDAPAESESWATAPPFVIGEQPSGRVPDAGPWRTAPSIVIENGDLIEDHEPATVTTPWNPAAANGGKTPRPWTSPNVSERSDEQRSPSGTIPLHGVAPATAESRSTESSLRDAPPALVDAAVISDEAMVTTTTEPRGAASEDSPAPASVAPAESPAVLRVEAPVAPPAIAWSRDGSGLSAATVAPGESPAAPAASAESLTEPAVSAATAVPGDSTVASTASAESPDESAESLVAPSVPDETPAASAASAEAPVASAASAEGQVATAERGEPGIGEAAPRRSGWWLSRRRRGPGPEPPRWD